MSDPKNLKPWHGVPRESIPWYPTVDEKKCIGCGLCFVTCGRNVYEIVDKKQRWLIHMTAL